MKPYVINGKTLVASELFGIQRNALELLRELDEMIYDGEIEIVVPYDVPGRFSFKHIGVVVLNGPSVLRGRFWTRLCFLPYIKKRDCYLFDITCSLPPCGADIPFVYDCIREEYPECNGLGLRGWLNRRQYMARVEKNLARAKVILTDSEAARQQIAMWYKVGLSKIKVVPCAWQHFDAISSDESVLNRFELVSGSFCFALGSRYIHKNTKWLLAAARQNPKYQFVVTGNGSHEAEDERDEQSHPNNIIFTGYLTDSEVKALMSHCKVFIQPSLCEGFGIPPMEAMSTGARCIVSNTSSLPEIYGESVWYIDPLNYEDIDIDLIMRNPIDANDRVLDKFSWKHSAELLLSILREV